MRQAGPIERILDAGTGGSFWPLMHSLGRSESYTLAPRPSPLASAAVNHHVDQPRGNIIYPTVQPRHTSLARVSTARRTIDRWARCLTCKGTVTSSSTTSLR